MSGNGIPLKPAGPADPSGGPDACDSPPGNRAAGDDAGRNATPSSSAPPPPSKRAWARRALVALVLLAHFVLMFFSARQKSPTSDEPYHIVRGVSHIFSGGDFRMSVGHPPLINLISAAPLYFTPGFKGPFRDFKFKPWFDPTIDPADRKQRLVGVLLWGVNNIRGMSGPSPQKIVMICRVPIMIMSMALGLLVYLWAFRLLGEGPAMAALLLYCFSPTMMAQGRLVTTDTGSALFFFLFAMALARHLRKPSWTNLALCGVAFGLAQLAKYTSILLIPMMVPLFLWAAPGPIRGRLASILALDPRKKAFLTGAGAMALILAIGAVTIWAGFGFETDSIFEHIEIPEPVPITRPGAYIKGMAARFFEAAKIPPRTYYFGLSRTINDTVKHPFPLYFMGMRSARGWWYYYPVLFSMKEPAALLALMAAALFLTVKRRALPRMEAGMFLVLAGGMTLFFMFMNAKNIGIRHLLPVYPFLFIWVAGVFKRGRVGNARARRGLYALLALYVVNGAVSYPHYLVHFNSLAGGPDGGLRHSVVGEDWGQDVMALGEYIKDSRVPYVYYNPYGNTDPSSYGVRFDTWQCPLRFPGYYAVHVVDLRRPRGEEYAPCLEMFLEMKPVHVVNHTIYIYLVTQDMVKAIGAESLPP